ncbi:hypothetical protein IGI04_035908 [Brassica rapa subsp. trilocularis]|uniref:Uncharacterized protein n=1 Tax=Brassica rapa subsp. trilocularis TaxID=1813537 RepID=A0ABQ7LCY4_BRACM|nr:hypothetical protein IGI04_035908 [Brassica rapa subsp. trilocularis]
MGRDMPRPTTRIKLEEEVAEVAMIAELAQRSRSRLAIKEGEETRKRTHSFFIELVLHFGAICGEAKRRTSLLRSRSKFLKRDYGPQPNDMNHSFSNPGWINGNHKCDQNNPNATNPSDRDFESRSTSSDQPDDNSGLNWSSGLEPSQK